MRLYTELEIALVDERMFEKFLLHLRRRSLLDVSNKILIRKIVRHAVVVVVLRLTMSCYSSLNYHQEIHADEVFCRDLLILVLKTNHQQSYVDHTDNSIMYHSVVHHFD